jgi:3-oxoacyl-[acyl-carrier-protein] synthase-3
MKIARDMLVADEEIDTIMVVGGYRNGDFVDYADKDMSMMFNLGAGGGAIILKRGYEKIFSSAARSSPMGRCREQLA